MLLLNIVRFIYLFSVLVLIFFINFSIELDSSFFILGGRSVDATNAIFGQFSLLFISSLIGISVFIFISSLFLITAKNIYFIVMLILMNFLFSFDTLMGVIISKKIRVFHGYTFNEATDNWLKATNSDGIIHYSISDLSMIFILLIISFAVVFKKKHLTSRTTNDG